jgi:hypothetical protein
MIVVAGSVSIAWAAPEVNAVCAHKTPAAAMHRHRSTIILLPLLAVEQHEAVIRGDVLAKVRPANSLSRRSLACPGMPA